MERKIYKSKRDRVLAGVCGGLADYFRIDVTLVRLVFIALAFSGAGILVYIVAAIIMPEEAIPGTQENDWKSRSDNYKPDYTEEDKKAETGWETTASPDSDRNKLLIGAALIVVGVLFLLKLILPGFDAKFFIPLVLIAIGALILLKGRR